MFTMEQTFIVTYIGVFIAGGLLGLLICWLFDKDKDKE